MMEMNEHVEQKPTRRRSVVGPVILILLGLAFLLQNLNLLPFDLWSFLIRLWPVWLIAMGLDLIIGRRVEWGSYVVLGVVLAVVGGAAWFYSTSPFAIAGENSLIGTDVATELQGASRADVEVRASVGTFRLDALPSGSRSLAEGNVHRVDGEQIRKDHSMVGETARLTVKSEGFFRLPFWNRGNNGGRWNVSLNPDLPISLRLGTGVGEARLDLSGLNLTALEIETGVGEATIIMPAQGRFSGSISTGIGETSIRIPDGMAAKLRVRQGIGSVSVGSGFERQGDWYVSPGFDEAEHQVTLEVSGGIGEVQIRRGN